MNVLNFKKRQLEIMIVTKRRRQSILQTVGIFTIAYLIMTTVYDFTKESSEDINPEKFDKNKVLGSNFDLKNSKTEILQKETINSEKDEKNLVSNQKLKNQKDEEPKEIRGYDKRSIQEADQKIGEDANDNTNSENYKKENQESQNDDKIPKIQVELAQVLKKILQRSFQNGEAQFCEKGHFKVEGMDECKPWLTCKDINDERILSKGKKLGGGIGKLVYSGLINGKFPVAIVLSRNPSNPRLGKRVRDGNENLILLQPSPYVVQVVGRCEEGSNSTIITESCDHCTDLWKFRKRNKNSFNQFEDEQRFRWAVKIIGGLDYLHHGMKLPRVHCDLHTLDETLTQYLIMKDNQIFMGDVDEIPEVDENRGIYANCLEETDGIMKTPEFIAPEQRYTKEEYENKKSRKPITEKSDIWKIPDITKTILQGSKLENDLTKKLDKIHSKCKNEDPKERPTARAVLIEYLKTYISTFG